MPETSGQNVQKSEPDTLGHNVQKQEPKTDRQNAVNFHITDDALGIGSAKEKFRRNVEAIRTLEKSRARTAPPRRRNKRFYHSMLAGAVLPMPLMKPKRTGTMNIRN